MTLSVQELGMTISAALVALLLGYGIAMIIANRRLGEFRTLKAGVAETAEANRDLQEKLLAAKSELSRVSQETQELQVLKANAEALEKAVADNQAQHRSLNAEIEALSSKREMQASALHELMGKIDIYSRIDEFVEYGHFETPEYLYDTSERFASQIKHVREKQRELIKTKSAVSCPEEATVIGEDRLDGKILDGQAKLVLKSFNIECDRLIGSVKPSNYSRVLERIEKVANELEKLVASLHCGISHDYLALKFDECTLQYQFKLKKQEEQEEQRLIRERMREEAKAEAEYRKALEEAEKEEQLYRDLLEKARKELEVSSEAERAETEARIAELEAELAAAEEKEKRAKSLAEQTRRGHVYVISNIGSFGDNVYKIGLTRRLDPLDRVKELGDASVPFPFDIHAIIYSEDAPQMESALHREFSHRRVNAVNLRKEFFRVELEEIRDAVNQLSGHEADFTTTIAAEEYYESLRLQEQLPANLTSVN